MGAPKRPRFVIPAVLDTLTTTGAVVGGTTTNVDLTRPLALWTPGTDSIGGYDRAGSTAETFEIVRDEVLSLPLRFIEADWPGLRAALVWAQRNPGTPFDFVYDLNDVAGTTVAGNYLERPRMGEALRAGRGDVLGTYALTIELRRADGTPYDVRLW